jgi:hypothetical protein
VELALKATSCWPQQDDAHAQCKSYGLVSGSWREEHNEGLSLLHLPLSYSIIFMSGQHSCEPRSRVQIQITRICNHLSSLPTTGGLGIGLASHPRRRGRWDMGRCSPSLGSAQMWDHCSSTGQLSMATARSSCRPTTTAAVATAVVVVESWH